jgi:hypothetical protein
MYTVQDFLNTLSNAGSLIFITINGEMLFKGKQIDFGLLERNSKYMGCKVWRLSIFDKYLWIDIDK